MFRYYYQDNAVSEKDCDEFIDKYKDVEFSEGLVSGKNQEEQKYRKAKVFWLESNNLLVRALWSYVLEINRNGYQLSLDGYENVQLTKYNDECFYDWHRDVNYKEDQIRKLSAVLQLSKPEDYKGCELQLFNGMSEPEELPIKKQGSLIVFKSDEWHRITKLTEGVRYSLVMWVKGAKLI